MVLWRCSFQKCSAPGTSFGVTCNFKVFRSNPHPPCLAWLLFSIVLHYLLQLVVHGHVLRKDAALVHDRLAHARIQRGRSHRQQLFCVERPTIWPSLHTPGSLDPFLGADEDLVTSRVDAEPHANPEFRIKLTNVSIRVAVEGKPQYSLAKEGHGLRPLLALGHLVWRPLPFHLSIPVVHLGRVLRHPGHDGMVWGELPLDEALEVHLDGPHDPFNLLHRSPDNSV